jgi:DHA2 family multidrug resistance protein-like MFS transporter
VAEQLPNQLGGGLVDAARAAFTLGLQLTAAICAVIAMGLAVLVLALVRHVRGSQDQGGAGTIDPIERQDPDADPGRLSDRRSPRDSLRF